jgi:6-phosphogluconate dehydrogenase
MKNQIGFIGLGRMGLNMGTRLVEAGYHVVGCNNDTAVYSNAVAAGIEVVENVKAIVDSLATPRVVWLMVPSKAVEEVLTELAPLLTAGDTIIDGGNSFYKDSVRRKQSLETAGINFLDCGTSGGVNGARHGASIMVGGSSTVFASHEHIFKALATTDGYARVGGGGAGHFVKMVHNGIEYGMMGAIAEGFTILHEHATEFDIDIPAVFRPYEHESVITSKLISWLKMAYETGQVDTIIGEVPTGETEFEMEHVTSIGKTLVLEAALQQRKETRLEPSYLGKLVAAMRNQFGGHSVIKRK